MNLSPAYGRDYSSKSAILADLVAGKDFRLNTPAGSTYINKEELLKIEWRGLQVRYQLLRKVCVITRDEFFSATSVPGGESYRAWTLITTIRPQNQKRISIPHGLACTVHKVKKRDDGKSLLPGYVKVVLDSPLRVDADRTIDVYYTDHRNVKPANLT